MRELLRLGFNYETINNMIELNPELKEMDDVEPVIKEEILRRVNCTDNQIRNIIGSNSIFLTKSVFSILELVKYLHSIGFRSLNNLFDSNPYILNLDAFEVEEYVKSRMKTQTLEEIVDDMDSNPYLFNEI